MNAAGVDIPRTLNFIRPNAIWRMNGEEYPGLIWIQDGEGGGKPTYAEILAGWETITARKVWSNAMEFWNEFTDQEKQSVATSEDTLIKLVLEELRLSRGEIWSDDPRLGAGLDAAIAAQIITAERKIEILS